MSVFPAEREARGVKQAKQGMVVSGRQVDFDVFRPWSSDGTDSTVSRPRQVNLINGSLSMIGSIID